MKTLKIAVLVIFLILFLYSCNHQTKKITIASDYDKYLTLKENKSLDFAHKQINFWQKKFDASPSQIEFLSPLADSYNTLFQYTGNIADLYKTEALLKLSNETTNYSKVGTIRSLAKNYLLQHRFKEALDLANKALTIGSEVNETQKLLFDVQMEIGNYQEAEQNLNAIKNMDDFDYLIRLAKWNDHKGDLDSAIAFMETARNIADSAKNKKLLIWSYENLAEIYGHAGRIKQSYNSYLKTLELDPNNAYALEGIAWIVFSYERNTNEANRIVDAILKNHKTPDFYLFKSQIAQYEGNTIKEEAYRDAYFAMLKEYNYGTIYNKYNVLVYADNKSTAQKALEIAKLEIEYRPTPDSYDLLAWSYYNLGENKKALEIAQNHVVGKTFEPKVQYHLAMIYKSNNIISQIKPIKAELRKSSFELGPNFDKKLKQL